MQAFQVYLDTHCEAGSKDEPVTANDGPSVGAVGIGELFYHASWHGDESTGRGFEW
jgi:hypothetical protein